MESLVPPPHMFSHFKHQNLAPGGIFCLELKFSGISPLISTPDKTYFNIIHVHADVFQYPLLWPPSHQEALFVQKFTSGLTFANW